MLRIGLCETLSMAHRALKRFIDVPRYGCMLRDICRIIVTFSGPGRAIGRVWTNVRAFEPNKKYIRSTERVSTQWFPFHPIREIRAIWTIV